MTKIRLNDMQLVLLASAVQREDGSLMLLPDSVGDQAAVEKILGKDSPQGMINQDRHFGQ